MCFSDLWLPLGYDYLFFADLGFVWWSGGYTEWNLGYPKPLHSPDSKTELFDTCRKPQKIFSTFIHQCPSIMRLPQPSIPMAYVTPTHTTFPTPFNPLSTHHSSQYSGQQHLISTRMLLAFLPAPQSHRPFRHRDAL